jgi:hypothetical protein
MNEVWQDATPSVLVAASWQAAEPSNDPVAGEDEKVTDPVGVVAPLELVSVTVAVQAVAIPIDTDPGEQETPVDVLDGGVDAPPPQASS